MGTHGPGAPPRTGRDRLGLVSKDFEVKRGRALPLGATSVRDGVNFAVYASGAERLEI